MALNLSTLTSPATSDDVLAEVLTTADFLEPVPVLRNLARGSNKGGDAKQDVALNQPKALPLIDGEGYLYLSGVSGNYASIPHASGLNASTELSVTAFVSHESFRPSSAQIIGSKYHTGGNNRSWQLRIASTGDLQLILSGDGVALSTATCIDPIPEGSDSLEVRASWRGSDGLTRFYTREVGGSWSQLGGDVFIAGITSLFQTTADILIGSRNTGATDMFYGAIGNLKVYDDFDLSSNILNCDFTSTNVRHNDTKFQCATGQTVTINQSGNDPATIIKKSVLRFDGVNDFMDGVFNQTITDGYMFAAFSVLGDGGESYGRVFGINSTGGSDTDNAGYVFSIKDGVSNNLRSFYNGTFTPNHTGLFDDSNGDILHELKVVDGTQISKVNNADIITSSFDLSSLSSEEFNIASRTSDSDNNVAIDLEYLALFPATLTDAQAEDVRKYINNRNTVFLRHDTDGYYFFDPQKVDFVGNFTDVNTLDGYITGSDNGDTDVRTNLTLEQATLNDQPYADGYKITFNDSAEHLEFDNAASQTLAGWQVVGTSLGTFAYKVNANAVTELNLLGNLGNASYRKAGDLYGIILLPESATGRELNEAKKLLTDRGTSVSATADFEEAWRSRSDIVQFDGGDMSDVTTVKRAWRSCSSLTSFNSELPSVTNAIQSWYNCSSLTSFSSDLSSVTNASYAWYGCSSLSDFRTTDIKNCSNFSNAWQDCSALTSFPADAKLGTEASNVNFTNAWRSSGLTSFSTPLPTAVSVSYAFQGAASLANFNLASLPLGETFTSAFRSTALASFSTALPKARTVGYAWRSCTSLTEFSADVFSNWNPSSIDSGVFDNTWDGCNLTAQSVENILNSIDSSGKWATSDGTSGGTALADAGIDIDYNGDPLSAATTAAIDSLSGKGWQVYINGELVIPNILDLQPAAAYSLRSFDADADPNVVNVRRSSDGATSDFTASEVSDGTLTSWVNTEYNRYTSDFSSGVDGWSSYAGTTTPNVDSIGGRDDCLRFVINGGNDYHFIFDTQQLLTDNRYRISAEVYLPSSNTQIDEVKVLNAVGDFVNIDGSNSITSTDEWVTVSFEATRNSGTNRHRVDFIAYTNGNNIYEGNGTDTFYVRNIQIDQLTADGHVTTWYDQSDNGNDSTQSTASAQPKIVDGGTLVTDSANNPAIIGDGVDDTLFHPTLTDDLDSSDFLVTAAYEDDLAMGIIGALPRLYLRNSSMSYNTLGTVTYPSQTGRNVISFQVAGNTQEVFGNGASLGTASEAQVDLGENMFNVLQGGSNFSDGPLMEVVVFGDNQSANRTGIENNINDTYTIY